MMRHDAIGMAVVVGCAALGVLAWVMRTDAAQESLEVADEDVVLAALQRRLDALETTVARCSLASGPAPAGVEPGAHEAGGSGHEATDWKRISGQLAALEAAYAEHSAHLASLPAGVSRESDEIAALIAELQRGVDDFPALEGVSNLDEAADSETRLRLERLALDPATALATKLDALRALGGLQNRSAGIPLSANVCQAALDLLATDLDEMSRRTVIASLVGSTFPFMREPIERMARTDASAAVRDRAVDALGSFLPDPAVAALLQSIAESDPDPKVQDEAAEALKKHAGQ